VGGVTDLKEGGRVQSDAILRWGGLYCQLERKGPDRGGGHVEGDGSREERPCLVESRGSGLFVSEENLRGDLVALFLLEWEVLKLPQHTLVRQFRIDR